MLAANASNSTGFLLACCIAVTSCNHNEPPAHQDIVSDSPKSIDIWPELDIAIKPDANVEQRVQALLAEMTLQQKVAQIIQPEIRDITVEDMRKYGFGSYLNGGGAFPNNDKHATPEDWVTLAESMYQASVDDSMDGSKIPTMWGTDAVHGHNNVIGATIFPHNIGLGAANNPSLIKQIAKATSVEVQATGIDWIFAPTVAAARDDRWGRTYESYSEDPEIIKSYSAAIVEGLQGSAQDGFFAEDNVISTVKHFIGDGGTEKGDDQGNNIASEQALFDIHAQGYVGGLTAGAQAVMASFNSWHGKKIHGDKYLLTDVLKTKMGFDGLVVGDWNGHGQIKGCSNDNCPQAINAGLDIYMVPTQAWKPLYENLIAQVKDGTIPMARLNDAVKRVLRVKIRSGLLDKPSPANRQFSGRTDLIGAKAHRDIAVDAVRQSLVLLKNNDKLLPLSAKQRILVAGDAANNIGKQSGGWSITWQGTGNNNDDFPGGTSIYAGIKTVVDAAGGSVELSPDGNYTNKPDMAIVVFGEEPYAEGNGDIDNLAYQRGNKRDLALLQKLKTAGIKVVSIFISGRPLWVNAEINASDAFVAAWLPGSEGQGIADVIFKSSNGAVNHDFTGRLSFTWPDSPTQTLNRNDTDYTPLFPYGYGLNYASKHENLSLLNEEAKKSGSSLGDKILFDRSVKAPWHLSGEGENSMQRMNSSTLVTDKLNVRTQDRRVQEDSLNIEWTSENDASFGLYSAFPDDLMSYLEASGQLRFEYQTLSVSDNLNISMQCMEACENHIQIGNVLKKSASWQNLTIDLNCFAKQGVTFTKIMAPFILRSDAPGVLSISDISIVAEPKSDATISCPID